MTRLPAGKLPPALLARLLERSPLRDPAVVLGPAIGEDACAIRVPGGVLIAATDPITLTGAGVGSHSVWVNANDVAVMGVRPRWFLASVLLPEGTTTDEVEALFAHMTQALDRLGASLVGGHTEITPVVRQPVVVGQMLGLSEGDRFVTTGGVRPGDAIVQVGPARPRPGTVSRAFRPVSSNWRVPRSRPPGSRSWSRRSRRPSWGRRPCTTPPRGAWPRA
jgi:hydrogenase maturation factor